MAVPGEMLCAALAIVKKGRVADPFPCVSLPFVETWRICVGTFPSANVATALQGGSACRAGSRYPLESVSPNAENTTNRFMVILRLDEPPRRSMPLGGEHDGDEDQSDRQAHPQPDDAPPVAEAERPADGQSEHPVADHVDDHRRARVADAAQHAGHHGLGAVEQLE